MDRCMPAHLLGDTFGGTRGKSQARIGDKNTADDHGGSDAYKQSFYPGSADTPRQDPAESDTSRDVQEARKDERGDLYPPEVTERKQTCRMPDPIESITRKSLGKREDDE
jgi:hypothetical protein